MRARLLLLCGLLVALPAVADDRLRPWVLGSDEAGQLAAKVPAVRQALEAQGFAIAGEYTPVAGVTVLIATSPELQQVAAKTAFGGYGAVIHVGLTRVGEAVQVSYANPLYWRAAYRLSGDLGPVAKKLEAALGAKQAFGSTKGLTVKDLEGYHYMLGMPYFTEPVELARFDSQDAALAAVEKGLTEKAGGTARVFRVDVPGKKETVFGVGLSSGDGADKNVLTKVDTGTLKHSPHLPYELLVTDGTVRMLHGRFRIAAAWPDLPLGTFMTIAGAPDAIEKALGQAAGKK